MCTKIKFLCWLLPVLLLSSCGGGRGGEEDTAGTERESEEVKQEIFHQQKSLQAGDSLQIRLLSWGGESVGNYLLLLADTGQSRYLGNSFFRKGQIQSAWVDDLDRDSLPEVAVVLQEQTGEKYGRVFLHELTEPFSFSTMGLPQLSETIAATYGGHDSIYTQEDRIIQEFRIRNLADSLAGRQRVVYALENNALVVVETEKL